MTKGQFLKIRNLKEIKLTVQKLNITHYPWRINHNSVFEHSQSAVHWFI